jgi:adenine-specific DNA-methyltransferase
MIERRLKIAGMLLNRSGALIITIDEHEVSRLGLLLEQLFPELTIQKVTIVNNPKGVTQGFLSRVEEYAFFCFGQYCNISSVDDDLLTFREKKETADGIARPRWKGLLRSGDEAQRNDREQMFYPIWVSPKTRRIIKAGEFLPLQIEPDFQLKDEEGNVAAWPVRKDRSLGRWGVGTETFNKLVELGLVTVGRYDKKRRTYGFSYLSEEHRNEIDKGHLTVLS